MRGGPVATLGLSSGHSKALGFRDVKVADTLPHKERQGWAEKKSHGSNEVETTTTYISFLLEAQTLSHLEETEILYQIHTARETLDCSHLGLTAASPFISY